jgi:uncharacterized protein YjbI with pentapeptide repeats
MATPSNPNTDWRNQEIKIDPFVYQLAAGIFLIVIAILIGFALFPNDKGYLANIYTTLVGVLITVVYLDRRAERREALRAESELKTRLIREMGSQLNEVAIHAVEELRAKQWLVDGVLMNGSFIGANLQIVNLDDANLQGIDFSYADLNQAKLRNADLQQANFKHAKLHMADLTNCNLMQADLSYSDLEKSRLVSTNLQYANLSNAYLTHADLRNSNLQHADLVSSTFRRADLTFTNLKDVDLMLASLEEANLYKANFESSVLSYTNLRGADLREAQLHQVDLEEANLQDADITNAQFDERTRLPDGRFWTPETDLSRFTYHKHSQFWRSEDPASPAY